MMDNGAADVSGSTPLITAPEEASDWSSSSLPPALPAHPSLGVFFFPKLPSSVCDQVLLKLRRAGLVFWLGSWQVQRCGLASLKVLGHRIMTKLNCSMVNSEWDWEYQCVQIFFFIYLLTDTSIPPANGKLLGNTNGKKGGLHFKFDFCVHYSEKNLLFRAIDLPCKDLLYLSFEIVEKVTPACTRCATHKTAESSWGLKLFSKGSIDEDKCDESGAVGRVWPPPLVGVAHQVIGVGVVMDCSGCSCDQLPGPKCWVVTATRRF